MARPPHQPPQPVEPDDDAEPDTVNWPEVPDPPPTPQIPTLLTQPVERPASMTKQPSASSETFKAASGYATAFTFIGTVLAFAGLGWVVDYFAGTGPWGLVTGLGLGFIGSTIKMVRDANRPLK